MKSVSVQKAVVSAAVLTPVDGLRMTGRVNLGVAQVRVQLIDERRTHMNEVCLTDKHSITVNVEQAQYVDRRQALQ